MRNEIPALMRPERESAIRNRADPVALFGLRLRGSAEERVLLMGARERCRRLIDVNCSELFGDWGRRTLQW